MVIASLTDCFDGQVCFIEDEPWPISECETRFAHVFSIKYPSREDVFGVTRGFVAKDTGGHFEEVYQPRHVAPLAERELVLRNQRYFLTGKSEAAYTLLH
jgi:hypothetical protein